MYNIILYIYIYIYIYVFNRACNCAYNFCLFLKTMNGLFICSVFLVYSIKILF